MKIAHGFIGGAGFRNILHERLGPKEMDFNKVEIIESQLGPDVYMLTWLGRSRSIHEDAAGGRIGVLAGPDGNLDD